MLDKIHTRTQSPNEIFKNEGKGKLGFILKKKYEEDEEESLNRLTSSSWHRIKKKTLDISEYQVGFPFRFERSVRKC